MKKPCHEIYDVIGSHVSGYGGQNFFPLEDIKISGVLKKVWDEKDVFSPHFCDLKCLRAQCTPPNMNRVNIHNKCTKGFIPQGR